MYKLMIVEDEPLIRAGLTHYFPWKDLGIDVILEAENGMEGVRLALQDKPDLIITDIRMPELDGLEMIERLKPELPNSLFIILTGYNEFQYAQRAVRLGNVRNYLLKPLEYEESLATVKDCLNQLELSRNDRRSRLALEDTVKENVHYKYGNALKHILDDPVAEMSDLQPFLELETIHCSYLAVVAACSSSLHASPSELLQNRSALRKLKEQAADELQRLPEVRRVMTYMSGSKLYTVIAFDSVKTCSDADQSVIGLYSRIVEMSSEEAARHIYLSTGCIADNLSKLASELKLADKALYLRYFDPACKTFRLDTYGDDSKEPEDPGHSFQLKKSDREALITCLEEGRSDEIRQLLRRLGKESQRPPSLAMIDSWLAFLQEIINVMLRFAHHNGLEAEGIYSEKLLRLTFVDDFSTAERMFEWISDWAIQLSEDYKEHGSKAPTQEHLVFEQIESFIRQHIGDDVTLQMVADRFFYNPSYLSRLFKTKLRKNYMTFVTEIRIQAAQDFLRDPRYLITEICGMCGYKSYKHFVKTFGSLTGMTPTEYRKRIGL
ncbi:response regulator [Paenibacillus sp. LHD-117]|uniref:response regulator n=1 Tax=Paenibacillus sp. LHD-117 TaxID=3071412 RepID=UPI0027DF03A1|nr:response regulator [Paenibacillus sp. LHD-117]MDQ6422133.1 response regulator [Paenibacillus sp. LHD-117]